MINLAFFEKIDSFWVIQYGFNLIWLWLQICNECKKIQAIKKEAFLGFPSWTCILGVKNYEMLQVFGSRFGRPKFIQIRSFLDHYKNLGKYYIKWGYIFKNKDV